MKKNVQISAIAIIAIVLFGAVTIDIYSEKQIKLIATNLPHYRINDGILEPLPLGELLYYNLHTQIDSTLFDGSGQAGRETPQSYKDGWRSTIANHPALAYTALSKFGKVFITAYNKEIIYEHNRLSDPKDTSDEYGWRQSSRHSGRIKWYQSNDSTDEAAIRQWRRDSIKMEHNLSLFSLDSYWYEQHALLDRYQLLIQKLLALDDVQLNKFISAIGKEQKVPEVYSNAAYGARVNAGKEVHNWLVKEKLIGMLPTSIYNYSDGYDQGGWYLMNYPCDLLLMTYRISSDYPKWTPRRFLTEAQKFSYEVEKYIP